MVQFMKQKQMPCLLKKTTITEVSSEILTPKSIVFRIKKYGVSLKKGDSTNDDR